uniref:Uncharacterized protein n=1 Tax=Solanum tuberosum TaxID=4113 RepID=M1D8T3_SOLTU
MSETSILLHEIDINTSAASSSNESNVSQELHLKRLKKNPKELNNQQCEFAELDSISIDTTIFEDDVAGSTMPLTELGYQVETSQNISTTNVGVGAHQIGCANVSKDLIHHLMEIASIVEPQSIISSFKLSYISGMCRTLCECVTQFCVESSENLKELEASVSLIPKGLREVNIINLSPLEVLFEDCFKKHRDYDVARLSTSQKITRDSHQELLSAAQQYLDTVNEERINMDKQLEELKKDFKEEENHLPY